MTCHDFPNSARLVPFCDAAGIQQQKVKPACLCSLWCMVCTVSMLQTCAETPDLKSCRDRRHP